MVPGRGPRPPIQPTPSLPVAIHHVKTTASLARESKSISQYCKFLPVRIKGNGSIGVSRFGKCLA